LWILEGSRFTTAVGYVLGSKDYVIYNTYTLSFDESIPQEYVDRMVENLEKLEFNGKKRFEIKDTGADIQISRKQSQESKRIFNKNLIPVGHMYSLVNEISEDTLSNYSFFVLDDLYVEFLKEDYGIEVEVLDSYDDLVTILAESDENLGLVEFKDLDFNVKVLMLDKGYYLEDQESSLSIDFYAKVKDNVEDFVISVLSRNSGMGEESWDKDKLVKINMSGVVAITRGLALKMDNLGDYAYPAREIGSFLADADLTHVSNEVSFVPDCKSYSGLRFCSRPEYTEVLEKSGVDIVELTGNHNNDFGSQYSTETIKMYKDASMRYFGGGLDKEDASEILYEEVKDSTVAFIGYNYYDTIYPSTALAAESRSGANSYSEEKMEANIKEAKENADVVIVTFQFQECWSYPPTDVIYPLCYKPLSNPDQKAVFRKAVDFGANIVIGTQAHQPQTYELYNEGVIFYGLGNLFFDQNIWIGTRQGLIVSHYVYEGKLIQSRVTPIYMGKDDLMPRLATQEQGDLLLELLRDARE
jgi:poly-gamma-glutamate synthesis protein (capsule biosynthesis protein)